MIHIAARNKRSVLTQHLRVLIFCCCICRQWRKGTVSVKGNLRNGARWGFYLLGMVLLAIGITLNSLTGLGASAIVSVPFTVSQGTGLNFGNLTLAVYVLFVIAEFL